MCRFYLCGACEPAYMIYVVIRTWLLSHADESCAAVNSIVAFQTERFECSMDKRLASRLLEDVKGYVNEYSLKALVARLDLHTVLLKHTVMTCLSTLPIIKYVRTFTK